MQNNQYTQKESGSVSYWPNVIQNGYSSLTTNALAYGSSSHVCDQNFLNILFTHDMYYLLLTQMKKQVSRSGKLPAEPVSLMYFYYDENQIIYVRQPDSMLWIWGHCAALCMLLGKIFGNISVSIYHVDS